MQYHIVIETCDMEKQFPHYVLDSVICNVMFHFNLFIMIRLKYCTNTVEGQALAASKHLQSW